MTRTIRKLPIALAAAALLAAILATSAAAEAPTVTTEGATLLSAKKVTLHATIDTHGSQTNYAFDYGTSEEFGNDTEAKTIEAGAKGPTQVSATIENLTPGTKYYFRAVALKMQSPPEGTLGNTVTVTPTGFYMSGEKSEEPAKQPKFRSTSSFYGFAHVTPEDPFTLLNTEGVNVHCGGSSLVGYNLPSTSQIYVGNLGGTFTECNNSTTVTMNGCRYKYLVANVGPPYAGSVEIACPEGKKIEIRIEGVCTLKVPAQTPSSTVSFEESNYKGEYGAVNLATTGSGLTFEKVNKYGNEYLCGLIKGKEASFGGDLLLAPE